MPLLGLFYFCVSASQLVRHGGLDFLVADYLSEITMSLLTAAKRKKPVNYYYFFFLIISITQLHSNIGHFCLLFFF